MRITRIKDKVCVLYFHAELYIRVISVTVISCFLGKICSVLFLFRQCKDIYKYNISVKSSYTRNKNYITHINCILSIDHWSYKEGHRPEEDTESLITKHLAYSKTRRDIMQTVLFVHDIDT